TAQRNNFFTLPKLAGKIFKLISLTMRGLRPGVADEQGETSDQGDMEVMHPKSYLLFKEMYFSPPIVCLRAFLII
ncbi:hypothetical protein ABTN21_19170, partial [Acinetobacter baumannii]